MYFYHLKFNLYHPNPNTSSTSTPHPYTPNDIFASLPSHTNKPKKSSTTAKPHSNSSSSPAKTSLRPHRNSNKDKAVAQPPLQSNPVALDNIPEIPPTPAPASETTTTTTNTSSSVASGSTPSRHPSLKKKSSAATEDIRKLDFRFGKIEIEWLDNQVMADTNTTTNAIPPSRTATTTTTTLLPPPSTTTLVSSLTPSPSPSRSTSTNSISQLSPPTGTFVPLSGRTNLDYGILHLYRDPNEAPKKDGSDAGAREAGGEEDQGEGRGTVVCVLAVPTYMSAADFLKFVAPVNVCVSHYRIIRDSAPNKFMVLMKFRDPQSASEFYHQYNGKAFSSMEPEICHVVYIKSVEFNSTSIPPYAFPFLHDTIAAPPDVVSSKADLAATTDDGGLYELPTCPVCLERMDASVTGLLTILCQHTFHCHCLSKWGDGSCPVCRYSQKRFPSSTSSAAPATSFAAGSPGPDDNDANECSECGATESLWICLICGHIGCGRYQEAHAYHHFTATSHLYALELETQRVWDYAGDGYVHRLIQNKADGKLVELPSANANADEPGPRIAQEKLDAISLEYTYLLTSQLDSQRLYYEDQLTLVTTQLSTLSHQLRGLSVEVGTLRTDKEEADRRCVRAEREVRESERVRQSVEKRLENLQERCERVEREREEERELNASLRANQDHLKASLAGKDAKIADLEDQVRDLMLFLEARDRIEADPELHQATIEGVVPGPQQTPETSGRKKKGRR